MTRQELLQILRFVDKTYDISGKHADLSATDARWNILSYCMQRHLEGKLCTITSVAQAAEVPYGTAMRRIGELIDEEYLMKRVRSKTGKSFSIHPTRKLIKEVESFAMQFKQMVGKTFGFTDPEGDADDFYFGGYYMASRILSYPNAMREAVGFGTTVKLLGSQDPTFRTLQEHIGTLEQLCGARIELTNLGLDDLHREIIENAGRAQSRYHLVAIDLPWVGELAEAEIIKPLDDLLDQQQYNPSDFHNAAYRASSWKGCQYGLPMQPTAELLFYRRDILDEAGLSVPQSTDELLNVAAALNRQHRNLSGIVMNYGRGTPVAHTFMQTMADFGQAIINLPRISDEFDVGQIEGEHYRPMINTPAGRRTAEFLLELLEHAHPESLTCDWDKRIGLFSRGETAMTYGWSVRAARFELNEDAAAHGKVGYAPHPSYSGQLPISPIGGFSLAIPSGLTSAQERVAWKVLECLTRPEMLKWYVQHGNLSSSRYSTSADPEVQSISELIGQVDTLERRGQIQYWPRPAVPEYHEMLRILGDEIYGMLRGSNSIDTALINAQNQIDQIMRANGHY